MDKKIIGICGVRLYEQNIMPFIQIMKKECEKRGFDLLLFSGTSDNEIDTDETIGQYQLVELMRQVDMCVLIMLTETIKNQNMIQKLLDLGKEKNIPVFSLDREVEGCYNLLMDNGSCFEQIVRHVVEDHGCRRVNMIAGIKGNRFSEERIDMYRKVLEDNGIPFEEERIGYGVFWECPVAGVMKDFFESDLPFPEAIVCANDVMAHAAISILNENGFEVPEDIIVTGYDGIKHGDIYFPSLTTGAPDYAGVVEWIFKEIDKYSEDQKIEPCNILVPVFLKKRQSCGCEQKEIPKNDRRISKFISEIGTGKRHMEFMHMMLSGTFGKQNLEAVFDVLKIHQQYMDIWFNFYRYVCIKSELLDSYEVTDQFTEVKSILEGNRGEFKETGKRWDISEFQSYLKKVLKEEKVNTILVHLLISGKDVYGFSVEGFEDLVDWQMKHCDEFAMFLSHTLHTVTHNFKMSELNENLYKVNKEIEELSLRDSMTGIYNRRGFFHRMKQFVEKKENMGKYLYIFMVDMDGLKYINDNYGHAEGDFAIATLANMLVKMKNGESVCARVGGDEFICSYVDEREQSYNSDEFSVQLEDLLSDAVDAANKLYPVSASVGMMSAKIIKNLDFESLINSADDKMYKNKLAKKKA